MSDLPPCPKCGSEHTYIESVLCICPECAHEWSHIETPATPESAAPPQARIWRDANGNTLQNGDSVTVIKTLKVKGSPTGVKAGTKVRNIRLVEGDHDIDCHIDGLGAMQLKSEFVKKA